MIAKSRHGLELVDAIHRLTGPAPLWRQRAGDSEPVRRGDCRNGRRCTKQEGETADPRSSGGIGSTVSSVSVAVQWYPIAPNLKGRFINRAYGDRRTYLNGSFLGPMEVGFVPCVAAPSQPTRAQLRSHIARVPLRRFGVPQPKACLLLQPS